MKIYFCITGEITNKAIQDNVDELFEELKPIVEKVLKELVENVILKNIEENIPFDKLYPNIP